MIGMQYKISLPSDYDMSIIKTRVFENGFKTDGFEGLLFKCYLIKEKDQTSFENAYSPLYIWEDSSGMNKFLFEGYYDNIIKSFGWQNINIGVPILLEQSGDFSDAKYAEEITNVIPPNITLTDFVSTIGEQMSDSTQCVGKVCIYNPDKWIYSIYHFYKDQPQSQDFYKILHISEKGE